MSEYHTSVLLDESVSALIGSASGIYADATFGGGGHTSEILRRLSPEGRVIAFDRDSDAIANRPDDSRLTLIRSDFRWIIRAMRKGSTEYSPISEYRPISSTRPKEDSHSDMRLPWI